MKRLLRYSVVALAIAAFCFGGTAIAAEEEPAGPAEPQVFDFEKADELTTEFLKPNTMMVEGLRRGRRSNLISVRLNFVAEIVKSAEDI